MTFENRCFVQKSKERASFSFTIPIEVENYRLSNISLPPFFLLHFAATCKALLNKEQKSGREIFDILYSSMTIYFFLNMGSIQTFNGIARKDWHENKAFRLHSIVVRHHDKHNSSQTFQSYATIPDWKSVMSQISNSTRVWKLSLASCEYFSQHYQKHRHGTGEIDKCLYLKTLGYLFTSFKAKRKEQYK